MAAKRTRPNNLIDEIVGDDCPTCDANELQRGEYKGNPSAICPECGPRVQVF